MSNTPLSGLKVLDFSQFLAGPYASLRLSDLGADVIKIERQGQGDLSRYLYVSDVIIDGESSIFHAINRGKRSFAVDLTNEEHRQQVWKLMDDADVVIQNFRPGVIDRLGFGYSDVKAHNKRIVYASISGYGDVDGWRKLPGQDLLAQAYSGAMWLTGLDHHGPVPVGLPIADIMAGATLVQGILALLVQRGMSGKGGLVETSLIEAITDLQFELLSTSMNNNGALPQRRQKHSAHAYLSAPYGTYATADGYIAIAMVNLSELTRCLGIDPIPRELDGFRDCDAITACLAQPLTTRTTQEWMQLFENAGLWAAPVQSWTDFLDSDILDDLQMRGQNQRGDAIIQSLLSPLRINAQRAATDGPAPYLSESTLNWYT